MISEKNETTLTELNVFWFRRDLRLEDNRGLNEALRSGKPVLPVFIFDSDIIHQLEADDARIFFIHNELKNINRLLKNADCSLLILKGSPIDIWKRLIRDYNVDTVFANRDYEPYSISRDFQVKDLLQSNGIAFETSKDQVIFERTEITKDDGNPYTVFTPYKKKWKRTFPIRQLKPSHKAEYSQFLKCSFRFPELEELGFKTAGLTVRDYSLDLPDYKDKRDFPSEDYTTHLGPHLRFGTVSIRKIIKKLYGTNDTLVDELIWREFFMQILYHFPYVVKKNFRQKYDSIKWRNNEKEFEKWSTGKTGFPMVDAGIRQLNNTGYMHNRVRMITAGFLTKDLLIDWKWGERYFAEKLLDYELSSNNGNWQWAAGTGCDAAPYFRIFNPESQQKKFDPELKYIKTWIPEFGTPDYPSPVLDHKMARVRALDVYKRAT